MTAALPILLVACSTVPEPQLEDPRLVELEREVAALQARGADLEAPRQASTRTELSMEGITAVGPTAYQVSASVRDGLEPEALARMARIVPHRGDDTEIDGFRLSAIRRNTALDQLGIRNGDILHRVNGHALDDAETAMKAYDAMWGSDQIAIELTRGGEPITLTFEIVP